MRRQYDDHDVDNDGGNDKPRRRHLTGMKPENRQREAHGSNNDTKNDSIPDGYFHFGDSSVQLPTYRGGTQYRQPARDHSMHAAVVLPERFAQRQPVVLGRGRFGERLRIGRGDVEVQPRLVFAQRVALHHLHFV